METRSIKHVAWVLPVTLFVHQAEEYLTGFPSWFSTLLGASLSDREWIYLNIVALLIIAGISLSYHKHKSPFPLVVVGALVFVNGIAHGILSLMTFSYSPGTISGVLLMIPLGGFVFSRIAVDLSTRDRIMAVGFGMFLLLVVAWTAIII